MYQIGSLNRTFQDPPVTFGKVCLQKLKRYYIDLFFTGDSEKTGLRSQFCTEALQRAHKGEVWVIFLHGFARFTVR